MIGHGTGHRNSTSRQLRLREFGLQGASGDEFYKMGEEWIVRACYFRRRMSRKGNCWDNAVMEAFFARLKVELIYPENYRSVEDLRTGLFEYIEIFYDRQRRHSALGYDNPAHYELLSNQMNVSTIRG
jgi:transposase InsO family protein